MNTAPVDFADPGRRLAALRAAQPLVHHLTNAVTIGHVADATLAIGALPIMAHAPEEVEEIAASAAALVLNLGTPSAERLEMMLRAGRAAGARQIPVVFDPVGAGASTYRTRAAWKILTELRPAALRANAGEAAALLGLRGTMRGVTSAAGPFDADALARDLSQKIGAVVAVTGPKDIVRDGHRTAIIENGDVLLARMTGGGDLATALIAAFAAVEPDALIAATCGLAALGVAAAIAAREARGPGSFRPLLLDALAALSPDDLSRQARIEVQRES